MGIGARGSEAVVHYTEVDLTKNGRRTPDPEV